MWRSADGTSSRRSSRDSSSLPRLHWSCTQKKQTSSSVGTSPQYGLKEMFERVRARMCVCVCVCVSYVCRCAEVLVVLLFFIQKHQRICRLFQTLQTNFTDLLQPRLHLTRTHTNDKHIDGKVNFTLTDRNVIQRTKPPTLPGEMLGVTSAQVNLRLKALFKKTKQNHQHFFYGYEDKE